MVEVQKKVYTVPYLNLQPSKQKRNNQTVQLLSRIQSNTLITMLYSMTG